MTDKEFWERFASLSEGEVFEGKAWYHDGVVVNYQDFKIIFDYFDVWSGKISKPVTRCFVEFKSIDGFRFKISNEGLASKISKFFGSQDVEINQSDFDEKFVVKANNEFKIKRILANRNIRNYLNQIDKVNLELSDDNGVWDGKLEKGKLQLSCFFYGNTKDENQLMNVLKLFKEIINDLKEIGSIY